jgi:hypothetical protein
MYWPIGAPRIYAASNSKAAKERVYEFDDDAESRETTEGSGSLVDAPNAASEERADDELQMPVPVPLTPVTPGIKPVEHDSEHNLSARLPGQDAFYSRSADTEPLLALRISRTGHLFAVITATSLTIWQTKVGNSWVWHKNN